MCRSCKSSTESFHASLSQFPLLLASHMANMRLAQPQNQDWCNLLTKLQHLLRWNQQSTLSVVPGAHQGDDNAFSCHVSLVFPGL